MDILSLAAIVKRGRESRGWSAAELAKRVVERAEANGERFTLSQQAVSHFEGGKAKSVPRWVHYAGDLLQGSLADDYIRGQLGPSAIRFMEALQSASPERVQAAFATLRAAEPDVELNEQSAIDKLDLVPVASIDMAYGMGGTFADGAVNVEVMHFPRQWLEAMTSTPAASLTWARGRGNSMSPTIEDNDLVLIDSSDRSVRDQDAIWAFTIGDIGMMKRLRIRGEKVTILSDNDRVPADTAHPEEINIVGRVSHIVRRV